jgi:putative CocE/NonD family hydrolase
MLKNLICLIIAAISSLSIYAQKEFEVEHPTDVAKTIPAPYDFRANARDQKLNLKTYYVRMRDSIQLAVDVYLPNKLDGKKIPVLIHQTRYWRSPEVRWPFKWFTNGLVGRQGEIIKDIVDNGYAVVNVDARGSGASFGSRAHPWTKEETADGAEIIEWILRQEWSNGNIGSMGVSYSGTTAEFLAFNQHPNLKAVILMYSLYDVYDDIAYPGGIFQKHFVNDWGYYNSKLDSDKIPRGGFVAKLLVKGVKRVRGGQRVRTFHDALRDHQANLQVNETASGVEFRDQTPKGVGIDNMDVFSPFTYMKELNASGTAVYCYSGWMDGDYQHANIRRYLNSTNPENKLIIGPWEHSGKYNCSPASPSLAGFDHTAEILKFFDYHLKGMENGLYDEAPIHYFTMIDEQWKAAETWPPQGPNTTFYFDADNQLSVNQPQTTGDDAGYDSYRVDTNASISSHSRWYSVIGKLKTPYVFPGRKEETANLPHYDSPSLQTDMEITGHPVIHLSIDSDQPDGNFHVYLDDVDADGNLTYITEGLLRGIHRQLDQSDVVYQDVVPLRNYTSKNVQYLIPGEVASLEFDLLPTSYVVKKGHRLRVSIAGADQTHFSVMHKAIPTWKIHRNGEFASYIVLPVVER